MLYRNLLWNYKRHAHIYWIYTFTCLLYFLDLSHGGYHDQELDDLDNSAENIIPTEDPFKLLVNQKRLEPYFDPNVNQNVTALVGKSAYLNCIVKNLGNKTVSWIRHRDLHILTVSTYTYTTDLRFQTSNHRTTDEWTLQIKWVQKRDAGTYDCQVSSAPIKSYSINLNVIDLSEKRMMNRRYFMPYEDFRFSHYNYDEYQPLPSPRHHSGYSSDVYGRMYSDRNHVPTAFILGGPEYFISKGSTINLTCIIKYALDAPSHTFWHFKDKILSFETEPRLTQLAENGESFTNYLLLRDVNTNDSGKYTCAPHIDASGTSGVEPASIMVHVVNGENPEAYSNSTKLSSWWSSPYKLFSTIFSLNFFYNIFIADRNFKLCFIDFLR